jgi:GT2 family glycosyltransferase
MPGRKGAESSRVYYNSVMQPPFFSVIVPTHGRTAALNRCLDAIRGQDYPIGRYEVIVVFDGSSQPLSLENENPVVQFLTQSKRGPAAARNAGADQAEGDYLAFTDDDCIPAPDWLSQLSAAFDQYPERMVGGKVVNILLENHYAAASQLLVDFLHDQFNDDPYQAQFFTSNNLALRRDLFLDLNGFDTRFQLAAGEDREFCRRWVSKGYGMYYEPLALVHHAHNLTLAGYWQQHFNYGRGAYRFRQSEAGLRLERPSFYSELLCYPLRRRRGRNRAILFFLFCLMQLANTAGFLYEGRKSWMFGTD